MKTLLSLIKSQKSFPLKSQGQSMFPILKENDIVYFKKISFSKIKINDIIVFYQKNQIICHRVIYISPKKDVFKKYLITKGDNSPTTDNKVFFQQILGRVYQIKRKGQFFYPQTLYLIQSSYYFNEIVKIKEEFDKQKINYLFLKGLPLHLYYEGKYPKRIYADCDLLIDKKDFSKAEKILLNFDYKKVDTSLSFLQKKIKDKESEIVYWKIINGFSVLFDLHLEIVFMMTQLGKLENLYPQKLINHLTADFLLNRKKIKINKQSFYILNPAFLILYLALHLFHHNFKGAFRYNLLDFVIRKHKKDANKIFRKIKEISFAYNLNSFIYFTFLLLKKYYKTPIPKNFLKSIKSKSKLTNWYISQIIKKTDIFSDEERIKGGIFRFINLFLLSPNPFFKKILVFLNIQVIYTIIFVFFNRLKIFLLKIKFFLLNQFNKNKI